MTELAPAVAETDLFLISLFAFVAVFLVLAVLAAIMRALTFLFPAPTIHHDDGDDDDALLAAITTAAARAYPGMRVSRVEESR